MIRYLVKFVAVTLAAVILHISIILYLPGPITAEYWVRGDLIVKHDLAAQITEPKIVFLSGSGTLFNVDAARISEAYKRPVVNFGLHAAMRLERLLSVAPPVMKRGDILVLPLEQLYFQCEKNSWTEWDLRNGRAWDAEYFDALPLTQRVKAVFDASPPTLSAEILIAWLQKIFMPERVSERLAALAPAPSILNDYRSGEHRSASFSHSPNNLDAFGSITNHVGAFFKGAPVVSTSPGAICDTTKTYLKNYVTDMRARGVTVVIAYAPYLTDKTPDVSWSAEDKLFRRDIAEIGTTIIGKRSDMFYSRKLFFNTNLHLNKEGQAIYTTSMIENLKPVIGYR